MDAEEDSSGSLVRELRPQAVREFAGGDTTVGSQGAADRYA